MSFNPSLNPKVCDIVSGLSAGLSLLKSHVTCKILKPRGQIGRYVIIFSKICPMPICRNTIFAKGHSLFSLYLITKMYLVIHFKENLEYFFTKI